MFPYKNKKYGKQTVEATSITFNNGSMVISWGGSIGFNTLSISKNEDGLLCIDNKEINKDFCLKIILDAFRYLVKWR